MLGISKLFVICLTLGIQQNCQTKNYGSVQDDFRGGQVEYSKIFKHSLVYPDSLMSNNISGRIYYEFEVDTSGFVINTVILKSPHLLFSKEIKQKAKLTNGYWKPRYKNGKKVNYFISDRLYFELR
jgi:outer membrane biosynthesis protein TonB